MKLKFFIACSILLIPFSNSHATTIDFETDANGNSFIAGDLVSELLPGIRVYSDSLENPVMIFDSANPTGGDFDLSTDTEGKILIISEDGDSTDPDDNASGGSLFFEFSNPVNFDSINLVDIDANEIAGLVKTYSASGDLNESLTMTALINNSLQSVISDVDQNVSLVEVMLPSSGGIASLSFDPLETPEPSTVALLALGLFGIIAKRRQSA